MTASDEFLEKLRADPGFDKLEEYRFIEDYDSILNFLSGKEKYPKGVPYFTNPEELINYFEERWESVKCHYC